MRANDLVRYIAQQPANPSGAPDESALRPLIKALDERCRTVEF